MRTIEVNGSVAPGYEAVREEFGAVVAAENGESGSQLAVFVSGRQVVDLWSGAEVTGETLTGVLSSTKGAATLVIALLVQDGVFDVDRPVADYWPEFGTAGKSGITIRHVLTHRSGMVGVDGGFDIAELADDRLIAKRVVAQRPYFRPGAAQAYASFVTFAIIGEAVRRHTGRTIQELFEERIRMPYGLDVYLGLPAALSGRYLPVLPWLATPEQEAAFAANSPNSQGIAGISYNLDAVGFAPSDVLELPNHPAVRSGGPASMGAVASARGLARMYAAATSGIDGRPALLTPDTLAAFAAFQSVGHDLVRGDRTPYALGFEAKGLMYPFLSANAFGHAGAAGSEAFADPRADLAYGYTRRRAAFGFAGQENERLAATVHRAVIR